MSPAERAKQFMPFAGVKGLEEALAEQEQAILRVERIEPSADMAARLDRTLRRLKRGMPISLIHYEKGRYVSLRGVFAGVDPVAGRLYTERAVIELADLLDISPAPD